MEPVLAAGEGPARHYARLPTASLCRPKVRTASSMSVSGTLNSIPRCFTVLADKVSQTTALDDKRVRKDTQETYGKLLDLCVLSGRAVESGSWIRRTPRDNLVTNGRDSPAPTLRGRLSVHMPPVPNVS